MTDDDRKKHEQLAREVMKIAAPKKTRSRKAMAKSTTPKEIAKKARIYFIQELKALEHIKKHK